MLIASGAVGGMARLRWVLAFSRTLWLSVIDWNDLTLDTRFVPGAVGEPRPNVCLYFIVRGHWESGDAAHPISFEAPCALVLSEEQLDGARGTRTMPFLARGNPFSVVEIHLAASDLLIAVPPTPTPITLDTRVWDAARRAAG